MADTRIQDFTHEPVSVVNENYEPTVIGGDSVDIANEVWGSDYISVDPPTITEEGTAEGLGTTGRFQVDTPAFKEQILVQPAPIESLNHEQPVEIEFLSPDQQDEILQEMFGTAGERLDNYEFLDAQFEPKAFSPIGEAIELEVDEQESALEAIPADEYTSDPSFDNNVDPNFQSAQIASVVAPENTKEDLLRAAAHHRGNYYVIQAEMAYQYGDDPLIAVGQDYDPNTAATVQAELAYPFSQDFRDFAKQVAERELGVEPLDISGANLETPIQNELQEELPRMSRDEVSTFFRTGELGKDGEFRQLQIDSNIEQELPEMSLEEVKAFLQTANVVEGELTEYQRDPNIDKEMPLNELNLGAEALQGTREYLQEQAIMNVEITADEMADIEEELAAIRAELDQDL